MPNENEPNQPVQQSPRARFPRPKLLTKIFGGFLFVIAIITALMLFVLIQLNRFFDNPDFQSLQLSEELSVMARVEQQSLEQYVRTRSSDDFQRFALFNKHVQAGCDSLVKLAGDSDIRPPLDSLANLHRSYGQHVREYFQERSAVPIAPNDTSIAQFRLQNDSLRISLRSSREGYIGRFVKALGPFYETVDLFGIREIRVTTASISIVVILALGLCGTLAFMIARALTRPIQALHAGTEKVGQGQYEIIPITSGDEVADLTEAFNSMSEKLKQLEAMRMQLMSEISHEMRTPLQVIKAGCYSVIHAKDGPPLSQKQRDAVGMIHQATNRINQFVNSFLDIAKMEAGLMKFKFEESSILDVLNPLVQEAQLIAQTRNIALRFETAEVPPLQIDKERIGQAFSNLLSNALKYTPNDGSIVVCLVQETEPQGIGVNGKGSIRIDVTDSGVGIPEADLAKLFQKFYQAKNKPLVNEKGSGLGLALVKHVTEAHGGKVAVRSKEGEGSTFSVILPL